MVETSSAGIFTGDGRGPELVKIVWSPDGRELLAIEYRHSHDGSLCHAVISGVQVSMITPDEVVGTPSDDVASPSTNAYAVKLGSTSWLSSFNPAHLNRCAHYRLRFYDETIDLICQAVDFRRGPYLGTEA